jgi:hypothetical protein
MLDASARRTVKSQEKEEKKGMTRRTKETKVSGMNDSLCIFLASQVIQGREMAPNVSHAKYSAMDGIY